MRQKIKHLYDRITPSKSLIDETKRKISKSNSRGKLIMLSVQCAVAACVCFVVGLAFRSELSVQNMPTEVSSVFAVGGGYALPIALFLVLCAIFVGIYLKNRKK